MAIELSILCGRWKTKQPYTFRAPSLVDGFEHLFSILLATLLHLSFVLGERDQFLMRVWKRVFRNGPTRFE